jgi:hypothetical protein
MRLTAWLSQVAQAACAMQPSRFGCDFRRPTAILTNDSAALETHVSNEAARRLYIGRVYWAGSSDLPKT